MSKLYFREQLLPTLIPAEKITESKIYLITFHWYAENNNDVYIDQIGYNYTRNQGKHF